MAQTDRVLLVHGLWMNGLIMRLMQRRIEERGYEVDCYSYPTIRLTLKENAERLAGYCKRFEDGKLHLVGHSMGGLIVLNALSLVSSTCLGRIVVAGTPFTDSFSARRLDRLPGGRRLLGKCIGQWLQEPCAAAFERTEIGVIAGDGGVGLGRFIAPDLPKPSDGVVSVSETPVPGMRDHVVLHVSHTAMLASREVARQICAFLDKGRFSRAERAAA
jgi:hypothetical protein